MPTREEQWLVRGPDGTMATVLARTAIGALRKWCVKHPRATGDVSVKIRGDDTDTWIDYNVNR
jgi:hypothetical protein